MTIFEPLSAGLRMMLGLDVRSVRALRSGPERLSGISLGGRNRCRALSFCLMNWCVKGRSPESGGSQLDGWVKGVGCLSGR